MKKYEKKKNADREQIHTKQNCSKSDFIYVFVFVFPICVTSLANFAIILPANSGFVVVRVCSHHRKRQTVKRLHAQRERERERSKYNCRWLFMPA